MKGDRHALKEMIRTLVIAGLIALVLKTFIIDNRIIPSSSMYPTIHAGDMVLVNKTAYYSKTPQRGDIVVFRPPAEVGNNDLIKRVIGLPGETITIEEGRVLINGVPLAEEYLNEPPQYDFGPVSIPEGHIFVLGDNRNQSFDGHLWPDPFLDTESVKGKAFFRYWPWSRWGRLDS